MNTAILYFILLLTTPFGYAQEQLLNRPWFLIFLDIDGVLFQDSLVENLWKKKEAKLEELFGKLGHYSSFQWDVATSYFFYPQAVAELEQFIAQISVSYQVGIVLSSAWREGRTLDQLRNQVFAQWHFAKFLIGKTVDSDFYYLIKEEKPSNLSLKKYGFALHSRGDLIDYWLREHEDMNIAHFVIFDDYDSDLSAKFPTQFIHVREGVLSNGDIQAALSISLMH